MQPRIFKLSNGDEIICMVHDTLNDYFKVYSWSPSPAKIEFYTLLSSLVGSVLLMIFVTEYVPIQNTYHWILMIMIGILIGF